MSRRNPNRPETAKFVGYVPVYLDDKVKKAIKANLGTHEDLCAKFERYVEDDYRLTIGWDSYSECLSASLYDTNPRRPSGGFILAAKHSDLRIAMSTLVYLHEVVYADGWDIERQDAHRDVDW